MKIGDIVKLMKAGYTPSEISQLEQPTAVLELIAGGVEKDQINDCLSLISSDDTSGADNGDKAAQEPGASTASPTGNPAAPAKPGAAAEPPAEPDYKQMYEDLLKKQQMAATRKDMSEDLPKPKTTEEILSEIAVDYM